MLVVKSPSFPQEGGFKPRKMQRQKDELQILARIGERKIKSIKANYELTESELLVILKLHYKHKNRRGLDFSKTLNIF